MLIRTEAPADILLIDNLLKIHAKDKVLSDSVMSLRENAALTLSLVACSDEGEVIGHVAFRPVMFDGGETSWQIMTPITVSSDTMETNIKTSLVDEAMNMLAEFGYPVCFGFEQDEDYRQFGFIQYGQQLWGFENCCGEIESKQDRLDQIKTNKACLNEF